MKPVLLDPLNLKSKENIITCLQLYLGFNLYFFTVYICLNSLKMLPVKQKNKRKLPNNRITQIGRI